MTETKSSQKITKEDFLLAKQIAEGEKPSDTSALRTFNNVFKWLQTFISHKYNLQEESFQAEFSDKNEHDHEFKIVMPGNYSEERFSDQAERKRDNEKDIEISIGEFILESLKSWNPDNAGYLTYIDRLLKSYQWRVHKDIPTEKIRAIRNAHRLIINKYNLPQNSSNEEILQAIMHSENFSDEDKEYYMHILENDINLNTPISEEDDAKVDLIDFISDNNCEQPYFGLPAELENIINEYHQAFLKAQTRTRSTLTVYITAIIYTALYKQDNTYNLDYLVAKYPDMIDVSLFPWINETIRNNKAADEDKKQIEKYFPTSLQLAEKAGKEWHAYLNIVKRFKNVLGENEQLLQYWDKLSEPL